MKLQIVNTSRHPLPAYQTPHAAAFDLAAHLQKPVTLAPGERQLIPTGLYIAIPVGYEAQIRPRSGLALKHGISMVNAPGTIDADYRGEWGVILINLGQQPYTVQSGDRIAQVVVSKHERIEWEEVESLNVTDRKGGLGSTGKA